LNTEDDLIFVSVAVYTVKIERGPEGIDAYVLFSHLCFTGKLQNTNSVWANRAYLKKGLKWAQARLDGAMDTLSDMKLISKVKRDGEKGTFGKTYIQVHRTLTPPVTVDSPKVNGELSVDSTEVRALESAKCLNESSIPKQEIPEGREDALSTSESSTSEPDSSPSSLESFPERIAKRAGKPGDRAFIAKIAGLLLSHSEAEIEGAIDNCMRSAPDKVFYIDADWSKWAARKYVPFHSDGAGEAEEKAREEARRLMDDPKAREAVAAAISSLPWKKAGGGPGGSRPNLDDKPRERVAAKVPEAVAT